MRVILFNAFIFATSVLNGKRVHAQPQCMAPPGSLIAWWPGDGDATDIIGSNDGDPIGDVSYEGDVFNLDGTDTAVLVPAHPSFNFDSSSKFTLMTWVYFNSFQTYNAIMVKGQGYGWDYGLWYFNNKFYAGHHNCNAALGGSATTDTWYHVALVWDNEWKLYVDGASSGGSTRCVPHSGANPIGLGQKSSGGANKLDGKLDELAIFNEALDENEIQYIYLNGLCKKQCVVSPDSLIGFWPGDGDARDLVGDNDGTPVGDVSYQGDVFNLLGNQNAVLIPYDSIFNFDSSSSFTLMTWVYLKKVKQYNAIMVKGIDYEWDYGLWYFSDGFYAGRHECHANLNVEVPLLTWHHVALVWDGNWRLYVDGINSGHSGSCPPASGANHPIGLGQKGGNSANRLNGKLDEVAIFNVALEESDIYDIYNNGLCKKNQCATSPSSLIGLWPGDGDAADVVGGNDGDPLGEVTYEGDAFNLPGADNAVLVPYNKNFNFGSNHRFTLMTWVYFNSFQVFNAIMVKGVNYDWDYGLWFFRNSFYGGSNGCDVRLDVDASLRRWYHVALTWDEKWEIYVDGVHRGEGGSVTACPPVKGRNHPIGLGQKGGHTADRLDGKLDEVAIFNRALDAREISNIYQNGLCKGGLDDDEGPVVSDLVVSMTEVCEETTITATVDDVDTGSSYIDEATCTLGDGNPPGATISVEMDPPNDITEMVQFDHTFTEAGLYRTCVFGVDVNNNVGSEECTFLPVYDPKGGYAKGYGWFDSTEDTETGNDQCTEPYQTGKAIFAFDCKYKNGVPTGRTEFNYVAGGLHLISESYDWIAVNSPRAIYQGVGKVNGVGSYGFLVSMHDGGRWGKDKIRVKIWNKSNSIVVYDNEPGKDDDAVPSTKKGGGSLRVYSARSPTVCGSDRRAVLETLDKEAKVENPIGHYLRI